MTNTNTTTRRLPADLFPAFAWTDAAGEIDTLASLAGDDLLAYCDESAANAREHGSDDVYASDLADLAAWLRVNTL